MIEICGIGIGIVACDLRFVDFLLPVDTLKLLQCENRCRCSGSSVCTLRSEGSYAKNSVESFQILRRRVTKRLMLTMHVDDFFCFL